MKRLLVAVSMLSALTSPAVDGATIFRCGNEYSDVACTHATTLVVAGAVTPDQRAEAREVAQREKTLAAEMTRDRREQEALAKPARAGALSSPPVAATPLVAAGRKHAKKHDRKATIDEARDFIAAVPRAKKAGS